MHQPCPGKKGDGKVKKSRNNHNKGRLEGGYHFGKDSSEVNLRSICDALDVTFVSSSWKSGNVDTPCMIASGMSGVMDEIYGDLNELCRRRMEEITIKDIQEKLIRNRLDSKA